HRLAPIRDQHEQRPHRELAGDDAQEIETGRVRPMEIFEEEHRGLPGSERGKEVEDLLEKRRWTTDLSDGTAARERGGHGWHRFIPSIPAEKLDPWPIGRCLC